MATPRGSNSSLRRKVIGRGATVVVQAYGEVLFMPGGSVANFTRRFSANAQKFASAAAPTNKRPRWGHYGKPLKQTISRSSTRFRKTKNGAILYGAVGTTAAHGYYVDQGTGVYAGNGPYAAKVLPPWERGSPSLYEHTWRPGGPNNPRVRQVMIRGQKGQGFLDAGIRRTFTAMRMRQRQVPADGKITAALGSFPEGLAGFKGNTPNNGAFRASLAEWRSWRDKVFTNEQRLGRQAGGRRRSVEDGTRPSKSRNGGRAYSYTRRSDAANKARANASKVRSQARRDQMKRIREAKRIDKADRNALNKSARQAERARFIAAAQKKYGAGNVDLSSLTFENGYWYVTIKEYTVRGADGQVKPGFREIRGKHVD